MSRSLAGPSTGERPPRVEGLLEWLSHHDEMTVHLLGNVAQGQQEAHWKQDQRHNQLERECHPKWLMSPSQCPVTSLVKVEYRPENQETAGCDRAPSPSDGLPPDDFGAHPSGLLKNPEASKVLVVMGN